MVRLPIRPSVGKARPTGLPHLLDRAIAEGLLDAKRFSEFTPAGDSPEQHAAREQDFLAWFRKFCQVFRNNLAHGASTLTPESFRMLQLVVDAINQIFPKPATDRAA
jgi:hypothetical protein